MTREEFQKLVAAGPVLLDGATGSWMRKKGMPVGFCSELWMLEHPELVLELQEAYVRAGSRILYTPSFSANRISLAMYGLEDRVEEINTGLLALSKKAAKERAYVAGDLTTTGKFLEPKGELSYEKLLEAYKEQIRALADAGADLLVVETLMTIEEAMAALDAAAAVCNLPVMCTFTLEADGGLLFGGRITDAVESLQEIGASAVGLNCSVGPDQLEAVVRSMKEVARIPLIVKPNAGLPLMDSRGNAHYNMAPDTFAESMQRLIQAGADIVGGCCGTSPEYIAVLAKTLNPDNLS